MEKETVTITKEEYDNLVRNSVFLMCLEAAGIDNTDAYEFGVERFYEENPEYDE